MFSVLVIRLRSLRLLRVSGIVMRLRMFLLLITFLKASHSFRNRLLVICKNAYLFATMIMTSVSSPFSCCSGIVRKMLTMTNLSTECLIQLTKLGYDATPFNQILKQNAKREMRLRLGKVTVADVLAAQPVTTNLLKFMRASIKMIGVSNLQS